MLETVENSFLSPPNVFSSKTTPSDLSSYLSRRRNTTGSISLNKIVDLKNGLSGNGLKLNAATTLTSSNHKLTCESNGNDD